MVALEARHNCYGRAQPRIRGPVTHQCAALQAMGTADVTQLRWAMTIRRPVLLRHHPAAGGRAACAVLLRKAASVLCAVSWWLHHTCFAAARTASADHVWRAALSANSSAQCAEQLSQVRAAGHFTCVCVCMWVEGVCVGGEGGMLHLFAWQQHSAHRWLTCAHITRPPCTAAVPVPVRCLDDVLVAAVDSQDSEGRERAERIAAWRAEQAEVTARWQQQLRPGSAKRSRGDAVPAQPPPMQRVVALAQVARPRSVTVGGAQLAAPPSTAVRTHVLFGAGGPPRRRGVGGVQRRGSSGAGPRTSRVQNRRIRR